MSQTQSQKQIATRGKRPRVQVSIQEKERAIERIRKGETKAGISRELGVPESTVRGWVKRADQRLAKEADCASKKPRVSSEFEAKGTSKPTTDSFAGGNIENSTSNTDLAVSSPLSPKTKTQTALGYSNPLAKASTMSLSQDDLRILSWLNIFNAGLLNFTHIASAASRQSSVRNNSNRYLWDLINEFIEEHGNPHCAQFGLDALSTTADQPIDSTAGCTDSARHGEFLLPLTPYSLPLETRMQPVVNRPVPPVARSIRSIRTQSSRVSTPRAPAVPPPFHITAPSDDSTDEIDVNDQ